MPKNVGNCVSNSKKLRNRTTERIHTSSLNLEELKVEPLIYAHFAQGLGESVYLRIETWERLNKTLNEALVNYNEVNAVMNLVLFEDAMQHVLVKTIEN